MARSSVKVSISETGPGVAAFAAELAGAQVRVGVQGEEAAQSHPNSEWTVGELAARHELGLGVKERSFLRRYFDVNRARINQQLRDAYALVAARKLSRKKAMEQLGYQWVEDIRNDIVSGKITPALTASTAARKGHSIPLLESATMVNAVTYKVFLQQVKSISSAADREMLRKK